MFENKIIYDFTEKRINVDTKERWLIVIRILIITLVFVFILNNLIPEGKVS